MAIQGHNFARTPVLNVQFDRGAATITYEGKTGKFNNNHLYLVKVGKSGTKRTMAITEDWKVYHYAKQD